MPEFKSRVIGINDYFDGNGIAARLVRLKMPLSFSFEAGQFVMIATPKVMNRVRREQYKWASMSIASAPDEKGFIELGMDLGQPEGVRHYVCTRLRLGEEMIVKGPFGRFVLAEHDREPVFIALGTGITPIISMVRKLLGGNAKKQITLFYSIKSTNLYFFRNELEEYSGKFRNFELVTTVTRDYSGWEGRKGRLQEHLQKHDFGSKQKKFFYICGSPKGVIEIIDFLKGLGFKEEQIKKEQW